MGVVYFAVHPDRFELFELGKGNWFEEPPWLVQEFLDELRLGTWFIKALYPKTALDFAGCWRGADRFHRWFTKLGRPSAAPRIIDDTNDLDFLMELEDEKGYQRTGSRYDEP